MEIKAKGGGDGTEKRKIGGVDEIRLEKEIIG